MAEAPKPAREKERLDALYAYDILDREVEPVFDQIIRIAADVCDVDISVIALIDDERQFFLARNNMKPKETPRAIAFCAHAILAPHETFMVENAPADPRFADNPLVTGEIGVRFYAAQPLTTEEGLAIGGLCLIGKKPKILTELQINTLRSLGNVIMNLFEARKSSKQAEISLVHAKEAAEKANRAKSYFLSTMSHELRTPLNSVIGYSDILKMEAFGPLGNERYRAYSEAIHTSANHLHTLIGDLLDISKIDAGHMDLHEALVDAAKVMRVSVGIVEGQAAAKNQTIEHHSFDNAPALYGDEGRIKQVVLNLLTNAIKYTPEGGAIVCRMAMCPGGGLTISITDNGIGIERKDISRILEPFEQVNNSSLSAQHGAGLGLALSKELMQLHGGSLVIDSTPGEGTTVTLTFPEERVRVL